MAIEVDDNNGSSGKDSAAQPDQARTSATTAAPAQASTNPHRLRLRHRNKPSTPTPIKEIA